MEVDEKLIVCALEEGNGTFERHILNAGQEGGVRRVNHLPLWFKGNMPLGFKVHDLNSSVFWKMLMPVRLCCVCSESFMWSGAGTIGEHWGAVSVQIILILRLRS